MSPTKMARPRALERPAWLARDVWPFEIRGVAVDGHVIHYVDVESGPTLLFVHAGMWGLVPRISTTIFGARNDPLGFQRHWSELFPHAQEVIVPRSNHFPMNDDPDLFADSVREWWNRVTLLRRCARFAHRLSGS